ncbi:hypothetical protein BDV96DRAFT_648008 [Lophiotrema nucula]|uniref:Uncharacterized protein n=1 Tax=Lophiotrema nucula TaxID=690887 RepID=A0A6A5Z3X7_9PLEO|nr:hypothetical protein BDV96DRAFT_648008 [Lophiotrema nucula]
MSALVLERLTTQLVSLESRTRQLEEELHTSRTEASELRAKVTQLTDHGRFLESDHELSVNVLREQEDEISHLKATVATQTKNMPSIINNNITIQNCSNCNVTVIGDGTVTRDSDVEIENSMRGTHRLGRSERYDRSRSSMPKEWTRDGSTSKEASSDDSMSEGREIVDRSPSTSDQQQHLLSSNDSDSTSSSIPYFLGYYDPPRIATDHPHIRHLPTWRTCTDSGLARRAVCDTRQASACVRGI